MKNAHRVLITLGTLSLLLSHTAPTSAQIVASWISRLDGPANYLDAPAQMALDIDGSVYVTGYGYATHGFLTGTDIMTAAINFVGDTVWVRHHEGIVDSMLDAAYDYGRAISVNGANEVFVTGSSWYDVPNSDDDIMTIKYDGNGILLWADRFIGPGGLNDYGVAVAADPLGGAFVAGTLSGGLGTDYVLIHYDENGDTLWTRKYNGGSGDDDAAVAMAYDPDFGCYVTGTTLEIGTVEDITTILYDNSGGQNWVHSINTGANDIDQATAIALTPIGVCVTGYVLPGTGKASADKATGHAVLSQDALIISYTTAGDTLWSRFYDGPAGDSDRFVDVAVAQSAPITVAVGYSTGVSTGRDALICAYLPNGDTAWVRTYDGGGGFRDEAKAVTIGRRSEVWVTGYSEFAASSDSRELLVLRYSATGEQLGTWVYGSGEPNADEGVDIVYDTPGGSNEGYIYVTGASYIDASYTDFVTFKLFGAGPPIVVSNLNDLGPGSLHAAIENANLVPGRDSIIFSVSGTIDQSTILPPLADASGGTVIDGFSAPGASPGTPTIAVDGSSLDIGFGIEVISDQNIIQGLEIRNFAAAGIVITAPGRRNRLAANLIHGNGGLGIDLGGDGVTLNDPGDGDLGANDLLNYPRIDTVSLIGQDSFYVGGFAPPGALVELYLAEKYVGADTVRDPSGHGEAWTFFGADVANGAGHFAFPVVNAPYWSSVTATATDAQGNTSEFSFNRKLIPDSLIITTYSPVSLIVIEPDSSDSIGLGFNTIGSTATYDDATDYGIGPNGVNGELDDRVIITNVQEGTYQIKVKPDAGATGNYFLGIRVDGTSENWHDIGIGVTSDTPVPNPVPSEGEVDVVGFDPSPPARGDLDDNDVIDPLDMNILIDVLFFAAPLPEPPALADLNCDGVPDPLDLNHMIDYLFFAGPLPCF